MNLLGLLILIVVIFIIFSLVSSSEKIATSEGMGYRRGSQTIAGFDPGTDCNSCISNCQSQSISGPNGFNPLGNNIPVGVFTTPETYRQGCPGGSCDNCVNCMNESTMTFCEVACSNRYYNEGLCQRI